MPGTHGQHPFKVSRMHVRGLPAGRNLQSCSLSRVRSNKVFPEFFWNAVLHAPQLSCCHRLSGMSLGPLMVLVQISAQFTSPRNAAATTKMLYVHLKMMVRPLLSTPKGKIQASLSFHMEKIAWKRHSVFPSIPLATATACSCASSPLPAFPHT